jgi:hypothetical protein
MVVTNLADLGRLAGDVCDWLDADTLTRWSHGGGRSSGEQRFVCDTFSSRRTLDLRDDDDDVTASRPLDDVASASESASSTSCIFDLTWVFWKLV